MADKETTTTQATTPQTSTPPANPTASTPSTLTPPPADNANASPKAESKSEKGEKEVKANAALVFNGTREVRRYTLEQHGKDFIEKAKGYAEHNKGFTVELKELEPGITCPSCGFVIHK